MGDNYSNKISTFGNEKWFPQRKKLIFQIFSVIDTGLEWKVYAKSERWHDCCLSSYFQPYWITILWLPSIGVIQIEWLAKNGWKILSCVEACWLNIVNVVTKINGDWLPTLYVITSYSQTWPPRTTRLLPCSQFEKNLQEKWTIYSSIGWSVSLISHIDKQFRLQKICHQLEPSKLQNGIR